MTNPPDTSQDYIEEKAIGKLAKQVGEIFNSNLLTNGIPRDMFYTRVKDFIRTALEEQKEMLEKKWAERTEDCWCKRKFDDPHPL